jgi:hypothetical protein
VKHRNRRGVDVSVLGGRAGVGTNLGNGQVDFRLAYFRACRIAEVVYEGFNELPLSPRFTDAVEAGGFSEGGGLLVLLEGFLVEIFLGKI